MASSPHSEESNLLYRYVTMRAIPNDSTLSDSVFATGVKSMSDDPVKVLVIEDDEYSRDALAHLLSAEGYNAVSASDGETGYARAKEINPDIIVLDLSLPGIDGRQVINMVRHDSDLKSVPILIITGQDDSVAKSTLDLGADAYLTKPIEFDDLTKTISDLNKRSSAAHLI